MKFEICMLNIPWTFSFASLVPNSGIELQKVVFIGCNPSSSIGSPIARFILYNLLGCMV